MRKPAVPVLRALALVGISLGTGACVERKLEVKTSPPDALVTVDGKELKRPPGAGESVAVVLTYEHYGIRNVVVRREGYVAQDRLVTLDPPWWQFFPIDFVTDVLVPWTIEDVREQSFTLVQRADLNDEGRRALLERAQAAADAAEKHP